MLIIALNDKHMYVPYIEVANYGIQQYNALCSDAETPTLLQ